jgi:hypothetical protein
VGAVGWVDGVGEWLTLGAVVVVLGSVWGSQFTAGFGCRPARGAYAGAVVRFDELKTRSY